MRRMDRDIARRMIFPALALAAFAAPVAAQYSSIPGEKPCPQGTRIVDYQDAAANNWAICQKMGSWDIARIGGRGSISGSGYNCQVMVSDNRALGATICKALPPPPPTPFHPPCKTRGCGVREPVGAGASWGRDDCSGLMTASLKAHCEARNAKIPAAEAKCAPRRGTKGYNACMYGNNPPVYDSFHFSRTDYLNCESSVRTVCKQQGIDWLPGMSSRSCALSGLSASCKEQMRLFDLCGDVFASGYYAEECLVRARMK